MTTSEFTLGITTELIAKWGYWVGVSSFEIFFYRKQSSFVVGPESYACSAPICKNEASVLTIYLISFENQLLCFEHLLTKKVISFVRIKSFIGKKS